MARWSKGTFFPGEMTVCVEMLQGAMTDIADLQRELFACQRQKGLVHAAVDKLAAAALVSNDEMRRARAELLALMGVEPAPNSGQHEAYKPGENSPLT
jgi:hypothetical protein